MSAFKTSMAVFILQDTLSDWTNLGKRSLFVWLDELSSVVRRSSRRRIMRIVPVFTLETNIQTNNECLPMFVQTDNASSSIKTANIKEQGLERYLRHQAPHIRPPISSPPYQAPHMKPPISGPPYQAPHIKPPISDPLYQAPYNIKPSISGPPFKYETADLPHQAPRIRCSK